MSDELPKGWTTVSVGEAATRVVVGYVGPCRQHYDANGIPFLMGKNVRASRLLLDDLERVTPEFHAREKKSQLAPNDVIVVRIGRSGTAVVVPEDLGPANCGGLIIVKNPTAVMPSYLAHYLNSPKGQKASWDEARGVTRQTLNTGSVEAATLPLAPLPEQQRIVAKLKALLGKVDASQQRLAKTSVLLKRFRQSVLAAACSGRLTADWREEKDVSLEKSWRDAELRDICSSISDGDHLPPPKQANGIPFLTIGNISSGRLDFSTTRFVSESYFSKIKPDRIPKRGDTLYTVVGATIGIPVMVDADQPFCFQRHIAILKPSNETAPEFLRTLMASPAVFRASWDRVTGSAQPTLPLGNLRTIPVSVPAFPEQQEIVRRVEGLFALADQLEVRLAKARGQVDKLTPSLLARAFAGQLVPQDPTDEPAEKLLERIRKADKNMKGDFSRGAFEPQKYFTGVVQQQGRVLLDSDWNEDKTIAKARLRLAQKRKKKSRDP